ncbi:hypothetical protein B0H15DRAFT_1027810 [Mycena belliarum]|uniref:Uncharacterized protein n=1 Tax=Mycena belliarum TaxID=1033014 RepID=A0AAD6XDY7_9AGAR|nr:hypothetical protein B0H15DRAFT_1027810 [Mycena belliae]
MSLARAALAARAPQTSAYCYCYIVVRTATGGLSGSGTWRDADPSPRALQSGSLHRALPTPPPRPRAHPPESPHHRTLVVGALVVGYAAHPGPYNAYTLPPPGQMQPRYYPLTGQAQYPPQGQGYPHAAPDAGTGAGDAEKGAAAAQDTNEQQQQASPARLPRAHMTRLLRRLHDDALTLPTTQLSPVPPAHTTARIIHASRDP